MFFPQAVFGSGKTKAAGCAVTVGKLLKSGVIVVKRGKTVVFEGKLSSLRRVKVRRAVLSHPLEFALGTACEWHVHVSSMRSVKVRCGALPQHHLLASVVDIGWYVHVSSTRSVKVRASLCSVTLVDRLFCDVAMSASCRFAVVRPFSHARFICTPRPQDNVESVEAGLECGVGADGFAEWQPGDNIECFQACRNAWLAAI